LWCKCGHVTLAIWRERTPRTPPSGHPTEFPALYVCIEAHLYWIPSSICVYRSKFVPDSQLSFAKRVTQKPYTLNPEPSGQGMNSSGQRWDADALAALADSSTSVLHAQLQILNLPEQGMEASGQRWDTEAIFAFNPCTPHPTPYTLHPTPYTPHPKSYTLRSRE